MMYPRIVVAIAAVVLSARPAAAQERDPDVLGSQVDVSLTSGSRARLKGELVAVSADSLWVLADSALVSAPLASVFRARVKRHSLGGGAALIWGVVGGVVTGGLLTAACSSVADDCGGVFPAMVVPWLLFVAISAPSMESSSRIDFRRSQWQELRAYARFPQGLPVNVDRRLLGVRVTVPIRFR